MASILGLTAQSLGSSQSFNWSAYCSIRSNRLTWVGHGLLSWSLVQFWWSGSSSISTDCSQLLSLMAFEHTHGTNSAFTSISSPYSSAFLVVGSSSRAYGIMEKTRRSISTMDISHGDTGCKQHDRSTWESTRMTIMAQLLQLKRKRKRSWQVQRQVVKTLYLKSSAMSHLPGLLPP